MIQIADYPRYFIEEDGQIWDSKRKCYIKQFTRNKKGYLAVNLYKDGYGKMYSVHRLVAQAYIPNPNKYPMVNHKDEVPQNNHKDNLEWCTAQYNNTYGTRLQKSRSTQKNRQDCSKPVNQYDLEGNFIAQFPSAIEVERQTKIRNSQICGVCNHRPSYHTAGGFLWEWADELLDGNAVDKGAEE